MDTKKGKKINRKVCEAKHEINTTVLLITIIMASSVIGYKIHWFVGLGIFFASILLLVVSSLLLKYGIPKVEKNAIGIVIKTKIGAASVSVSTIKVTAITFGAVLFFATLCILAAIFHK